MKEVVSAWVRKIVHCCSDQSSKHVNFCHNALELLETIDYKTNRLQTCGEVEASRKTTDQSTKKKAKKKKKKKREEVKL